MEQGREERSEGGGGGVRERERERKRGIIIARIMHEVNLEPLKEFTYLLHLESFVTCGVPVRYKLLHSLLYDIQFYQRE